MVERKFAKSVEVPNDERLCVVNVPNVWPARGSPKFSCPMS